MGWGLNMPILELWKLRFRWSRHRQRQGQNLAPSVLTAVRQKLFLDTKGAEGGQIGRSRKDKKQGKTEVMVFTYGWKKGKWECWMLLPSLLLLWAGRSNGNIKALICFVYRIIQAKRDAYGSRDIWAIGTENSPFLISEPHAAAFPEAWAAHSRGKRGREN